MNTFEQSFSYFYSNFLDIFNANIPLKTIQLKYNNRISFLTDGLKKSIKQNIGYSIFLTKILQMKTKLIIHIIEIY